MIEASIFPIHRTPVPHLDHVDDHHVVDDGEDGTVFADPERVKWRVLSSLYLLHMPLRVLLRGERHQFFTDREGVVLRDTFDVTAGLRGEEDAITHSSFSSAMICSRV